ILPVTLIKCVGSGRRPHQETKTDDPKNLRSSAPISNTGWGGRIRTYACRIQRPVPYHLATPQRKIAETDRKRSKALVKVPRGTRPAKRSLRQNFASWTHCQGLLVLFAVSLRCQKYRKRLPRCRSNRPAMHRG